MCTKSIYKENTPVHSQTCIKRSPLGQRKTGLIRGSIHIKFSMTGQENGDLLIQVTACAGLILSEYLYLNPWSTALKVSTLAITPTFTKRKFKKWQSSIQRISTKQTITSHPNWTYWTQKRPWHMMLEIQFLA